MRCGRGGGAARRAARAAATLALARLLRHAVLRAGTLALTLTRSPNPSPDPTPRRAPSSAYLLTHSLTYRLLTDCEQRDATYTLFGLVAHSGRSGCGHYTSYVQPCVAASQLDAALGASPPLQRPATPCNALQRPATPCNALQRLATPRSAPIAPSQRPSQRPLQRPLQCPLQRPLQPHYSIVPTLRRLAARWRLPPLRRRGVRGALGRRPRRRLLAGFALLGAGVPVLLPAQGTRRVTGDRGVN